MTLPTNDKSTSFVFRSLDDIRQRKEQLAADIQSDNNTIATQWHQLFTHREATTKAEFITTMISNSITAIDAFLLVRKLMKNYGILFERKRKKKR